MNYYYLMRPCIHDILGRENIKELLDKRLDQFVDYKKIEDWFSLNKYTLSSLPEIDGILDIRSNKKFHVIALYVSPYKRFFSYYLATLASGVSDDLSDMITPDGFFEFFKNRDALMFNGMLVNLSELYKETPGLNVAYKIEYDTLVSDLKKIPGLEFVPDDFILQERNLANQYRSYYNQEIKDWVSETYAKDIQEYGYTF